MLIAVLEVNHIEAGSADGIGALVRSAVVFVGDGIASEEEMVTVKVELVSHDE